MKKVSFLSLIFLFTIILTILIDCHPVNEPKDKKEKPVKKDKKKKSKSNKDEITSILQWAKKNNIYINEKLKLNRQSSGHNFYFFSADSKIPNNTLLLRVPYNMMLTQHSFDSHYKATNSKKMAKIWDILKNLDNEYIKYFSTKQLCYIAIIMIKEIKNKKGYFYKKFKPYFKMYKDMNLDVFPIFYDENEKYYLSGSSFGSQITRAIQSLNEEYYVVNNVLNISAPYQDDFMKYRVLTLTNSIDFNNSNYNYTNGFNETVIIPFIDLFNKAISSEKANAVYSVRGEKRDKNDNSSFTDYYFEVYTSDELMIGSEINLQWRIFPNSECLLYYGFVEEGNPLKPRYYIDVVNKKLRKKVYLPVDAPLEGISRDFYELSSEFFEPWLINSYRNISKNISRYNSSEEGPYEMMKDNLVDYLELYDRPLTDGNINLYMNGETNVKNIKEIMHMERKIIQEKVDHLEKVIEGIRLNNYNEEMKKKEAKKQETKKEENKKEDEKKDENKEDL